MNQVSLQRTSYGPYARAMVRICKEESFHQRQGYEIMATMMAGNEAQKEMAQDAMNRWWWPSLMMFGPHDTNSPHSSDAVKWKIKRETNDELRQKFIDKTIPQAELIGLTVPDKHIKLDEKTGHYTISEINWDEFNHVIAGNACFGMPKRHALAAALPTMLSHWVDVFRWRDEIDMTDGVAVASSVMRLARFLHR